MDRARALGIDEALAIDHLIGPALAVRRLDADDRPAAIVAVAAAARGRGLGEAALAEACGQLLAARKATVKPSDIEGAIDAAAAIERRLADACRRRAALPRHPVMPIATVDFRSELQRMAPADHLAAWWPCLDDVGVVRIDEVGTGRRATIVTPERPSIITQHGASWAAAAIRAAIGPDVEVEFVQGVGEFFVGASDSAGAEPAARAVTTPGSRTDGGECVA